MTKSEPSRSDKGERIPITSHVSKDLSVEMTFDPETSTPRLVTFREGVVSEEDSVEYEGKTFVPYSADNNLLTHRVLLFAAEVADYDSESGLVEEVRDFIHRYVDLEGAFEELAAHYVLMTWRYDLFQELPYLRVVGNFGQGKSRFLMTVGSLCFKPIFASGASTVSPIFRLLDEVGGTLVIDEADFRASDERAEIVKILNNGHAVGFSVLRSDVTPSKEFRPRAFRIFGPKLIATRHDFEDAALESRCFTATLGSRPLRPDIPITLPPSFDTESLRLRNKLLMYRFRRFETRREAPAIPSDLSPRLAQILLPLLNVACSSDASSRLTIFARGTRPSASTYENAERLVVCSVGSLINQGVVPIPLGRVVEEFRRQARGAYGNEISPRFIGGILRRLGIALHKTGGVFVVPLTELPRFDRLFERYVKVDDRDIREERDVSASSPSSLISPH